MRKLLVLLVGVSALLMSCSGDDDPVIRTETENYEIEADDRVAILFGGDREEVEAYRQSAEVNYIQKVFTAHNGNLDQLARVISQAKGILLYIDARGMDESRRAEVIRQLSTLWASTLQDRKDATLVALRADRHNNITQRMLGCDIGEGFYLFSTRMHPLVLVEPQNITMEEISWLSAEDYVLRNGAANGKRTNDATEAKVRFVKNLQFYYERDSVFRWNVEGVLHPNALPASTVVEGRSAVVDLFLVYDVHSAVGSKDRYISLEVKGNGYKTNIRTRDQGSGFVYPYGVHTGVAYTGNLIRKFTLESEFSVPATSPTNTLTVVEYLPENVIKTTEISSTKSHEISIAGKLGGGPGGVVGDLTFGYSYGWSSTVAYTQADFEMHNSFTALERSKKITWTTIPAMWRHKEAYKNNNTNKDLDVGVITKGWVPAGKGTVFYDMHASDFPMGFHNMAPQASMLVYTNDNIIQNKVTATLELQDTKQYWCAGTRYNGETESQYRYPSGSVQFTVEFSEDGLIFR